MKTRRPDWSKLLHQLFPARSLSVFPSSFSQCLNYHIERLWRRRGGRHGCAEPPGPPPHMKAAPSSGLHYWHTDIWDIFFRFSNNRLFDLWTGIRISLQEGYRWKDNREWEICTGGEKMIFSSRTAHDSFLSALLGIVLLRFGKSSSVTLKTLSELFWIGLFVSRATFRLWLFLITLVG